MSMNERKLIEAGYAIEAGKAAQAWLDSANNADVLNDTGVLVYSEERNARRSSGDCSPVPASSYIAAAVKERWSEIIARANAICFEQMEAQRAIIRSEAGK